MKNPIKGLLWQWLPLVVAVQCSSPVSMDVEWIIQGSDFGTTGFVIELMGIASALTNMLPRSRVVKSYFVNNTNENALVPSFLDLLLQRERQLIEILVDKSRLPNIENPIKFRNFSRLINASVCLEKVYVTPNNTEKYLQLTRPLVPVTSQTACCMACVDDPLCIAWSFGCEIASTCYLYGSKAPPPAKAVLSPPLSTTSTPTSPTPCGQAIHDPTSLARLPAPRALIFHGTSCAYLNQSIDNTPRTISTLWIGRFMLERGGEFFLANGLTREELEVLRCACKMDEVWVPTEWNKKTIQAIALQMNMRLPHITVIPEAVDSTLFLPRDNAQTCTAMARDRKARQEPDTFQFLSVFKWEHRKGWDILLEAYWSTFTPSDNVVLRLQTYRPSFLPGHNITAVLQEFALTRYGKRLENLARISLGGESIYQGMAPPQHPHFHAHIHH